MQFQNQVFAQFEENQNNTMLIYHFSKLLAVLKMDLTDFKPLWEETLQNLTSTDFDSYLKIRLEVGLNMLEDSEFQIENGYGCLYATEIFEGTQKIMLVA